MYNEWTSDGVEGSSYAASENGWMMDYIFEQWFVTIFVKFVSSYHKTVLLTYDGHNSHLTYTTVKTAMDNQIIIVCLPPNTSHALQPLDVAVFRSARKRFKDTLNDWLIDTRREKVDKTVFPQILKRCWLTLDKTHAISGFRKTGLYPVDRTAVKNKILRTASDVPVDGPGRSPGRLLRSAILRLQ